MPNLYPKTVSKGPAAPAAANDNYKSPLSRGYTTPPVAANDNDWGRNLRLATGAMRRQRLGDIRAELAKAIAAEIIDWGIEQMFGPVKTPAQPALPARIDPGKGWHKQNDYGSVPNFDVPGVDVYGNAWPNITFRTNYDYNYALAGWGGMGYVSEFFQAPTADEFSTWAGAIERASGNNYWRVWAAEKWIRTTAEPFVYPPILPPQPAKAPGFAMPRTFPRFEPGWYRRAADKPHLNPHGDPIRGPVGDFQNWPGARPDPNANPLPRPTASPLPRPPGKRVKETKVSKNGIYGAMRFGFGIIEGASEIKDFVNAFFEGMPDWVKRQAVEGDGYKGVIEKAGLIYDNLPHWDAGKGLAAIAANQLEDKIVGRAHGAVAKATKDLDIVRGPAMGGFI